MHFIGLATDYDGTLATEGRVEESTFDALKRFRRSGRKLILVTGRELPDLERVFPEYPIFDRIVAENGALLFDPATRKETLLGPPASQPLAEWLQRRGVKPLSVGRGIIGIHEPYGKDALQGIQELGLELQVVFNKGSVMILPSGVNKETGLRAALAEMGLSPLNIAGVGDAENDHALLRYCGCGVAVATALPALKDEADLVLKGGEGQGVEELIEAILRDDLADFRQRSRRHSVLLGRDDNSQEIRLAAPSSCTLIAGPSGSGKTTVATAVLERVAASGLQFCVFDPEGDYEQIPGAVRLGDPKHAPSLEEVMQLIEAQQSPILNLLGIPLADRPGQIARILGSLQELRARTGRPHWLVLDEAHHLFPTEWRMAPGILPTDFSGTLMVTVHPDRIAPDALRKVDVAIAVGPGPEDTLGRLAKSIGMRLPNIPKTEQRKLDTIVWYAQKPHAAFHVRVEPGTIEHSRHQRKYARGDLEEDSFYFRGREGKLNLRAQNLQLFTQLAEGVDEDTWLFHLKQGDYSAWIRRAIQDDELANKVAAIEKSNVPAAESRKTIREAIEKAYTAAA